MKKGLALFLGLGTLGALSFYLFKQAKAAEPQGVTPFVGPAPPTPGTVTPLATQAPTPAAAPSAVQTAFENPPRLLPDPFRVVPGQRYRWRYQKGAFDVAGSGFSNVKTYDQPMQLPPDWPTSMIAESSMTGYASGTWNGAAGDLTKPFGVYQIWPTMAST